MKPCFVCSQPMTNVIGQPVPGVTRNYHGTTVTMHKTCSKSFDKDEATVTAIAATDEVGVTFDNNVSNE